MEKQRAKQPTKKAQILSLYRSGIQNVEDLALLTGSRPSYVGAVLREAGLAPGYVDLYTSTRHPMNVYSRYFAGRLGYRDVETARESVALIDQLYRQFARTGDRAGQHHAMVMALTMFNRARWSGKQEAAEVYRRWLLRQLRTARPRRTEKPENTSTA
ncbi:hypothetical protein [Rhodothermus marinus]|uniref:hypothetical protein n=1 Tax=Rhodothermus marinus TaxID=29549 RepID=UPI0012BA4394|nr:hypothetical protein [Rhodothermus marinus]BBM68905.1 hypothetical protein RmaAA213_07510 [Rhodothermus marinus]BBM71883.1 hypothetical protein RmaAA338_07480 [Rhodothermus marinus]